MSGVGATSLVGVSARNTSARRADEGANPARQPRAHKDRRRWCRGKAGVEHELVFGRLRNHWYFRRTCGWLEQNWRGPWAWWLCAEQEYCASCGRVFAESLGARCTVRWVEPRAFSVARTDR